jgi:integrase
LCQGQNWGPNSAASRRTIRLPASTIKALMEWKLACPASNLGLVFPSVAKKVMSYRHISLNVLGPVLKKAKVAGVTLHDLRHSAASLWIEQRIEPERVQTWLGHHSVQMRFDTYEHLFEAVERENSVAAAIERS